MIDLGWAVVANITGLVFPTITAIKQKHYVKRADAVFCGLSLFLIAVGLIFEHPSLKLWQLPLYAYPLVIGLFGIGLTVKKEKLGTIILIGWTTTIIGIIILIVQLS